MKLEFRYAIIPCAFVLAATTGCASVAPRELVEARAAYLEAANGPAATLAPSQLDTARKALEQAEREFAENPDEPETRDYAYIAQRQAQLAGVKASAERSSRTKRDADARLRKNLKEDLATSKEKNRVYRDELADSKDELADSKDELAVSKDELAVSKDELETEKQARITAEDQADALISKLEKIASVKQEQDRIVISLSGSILFASGKSTLLSGASTTLDGVADALQEIKEPRTITIEGHTDSMGSDESNQTLSFSRAEGVRAYLESRGITAHMESVGVGESRPIAENTTPEGRANNRRVEIIVSPNPS